MQEAAGAPELGSTGGADLLIDLVWRGPGEVAGPVPSQPAVLDKLRAASALSRATPHLASRVSAHREIRPAYGGGTTHFL